ncbi:MAG: PAS domain S-box protein [Nitrospirae bacterium]|nr:MAG: PAS domain S-box protein [Nitrospirota bacterium]
MGTKEKKISPDGAGKKTILGNPAKNLPAAEEYERLAREHTELSGKYATAVRYIRDKIDQLLTVMGTSALKPEELDDKTLIETDPIGIISSSFVQILKHLHKTNAALKMKNREIKAIFDSAGTGVLVIDRDMKILEYNTRLREQFFPDKVDINGLPCHALICNLKDPLSACPFRKVFETGESVHMKGWVLHNRHYDIVGTPLKDNVGEVTGAVILYMDITDHVRTEAALRQSEEKYRDLFENANDLIQSIGPDGSILYVNQAWLETLEYSREEVPDISIFDIIHPDCDECGADFKSVVFGERAGRVETVFITKTGKRILVEGNISTVFDSGRLIGTRGIFRDITERKKAEEVLASEREQLAVTLRCIGDGVITTDTAGNIVLMNKVSEALTGWSQGEARGRPISEVFRLVSEDSGAARENPVDVTLKTGRIMNIPDRTVLVSRTGVSRIIADSVAPIIDRTSNIIGTVLVFRDITEKRYIEEKLLQSGKIESLGILAGGIAHDFNNLLNAIMGNIDLALAELDGRDQLYETLTRAEKAALRAKDLTQQLLTFSKGGAPIKKTASITELIRESSDFAVRGSNAQCIFNLPEDLWKVEIDMGQMSQVINNIVLNAVSAMPDGGQIVISAVNMLLEQDRPELKQGRYVKIAIQDTGTGIPKEHLGRIFEPYFTTKHTGSGLGLATTYSIIQRHDGLIEVESEVGKGTTFFLYLPAAPGDRAPEEQSSEPRAPVKGWGRVLLMDDNEMVSYAAGEMLKRIGYDVVIAAEGNEALTAYKTANESGRRFDAVILDLTIPAGMGGKETMKKLLDYDPEVKAIVSSGYSSDAMMANYREYGFSGVLTKPYQMKDLREVLHQIISGEK